MKITNISNSVLTFGYGKEAESIRPGETSSDLKLAADDRFVVAHLAAKNIEVAGRNAPKAEGSASQAS